MRQEQSAWVLILVKIQKRCRWSEAFSVWWYMNCFEEAMTLGGFLTEVKWLQKEDILSLVLTHILKQEAMYSVKYTEHFNGSRLKCRNVL